MIIISTAPLGDYAMFWVHQRVSRSEESHQIVFALKHELTFEPNDHRLCSHLSGVTGGSRHLGGEGQFNMFRSILVYFFIGGGPKSLSKLEGGPWPDLLP